jgi:hypothetical protein
MKDDPNHHQGRIHLMGLNYQTEYRLGRRGGRVCRTYTGLRAIMAIAIDLFFVFTFELVFGLLFFILKNLSRIVLTLVTTVFYLLSLPFRVANWVSLKLEGRFSSNQPDHLAGHPSKPAWAGYDEI